ncbi:MAG: cryptochrome/photolyase family protein [Pseudomonadota bacterium]
MTTLRLILGDQLSQDIAALNDYEAGDVVMGAEVHDEATYVPHHKQKIVLIFSAMRHFFAELDDAGFATRYWQLGAHQSLFEAVRATAQEVGAKRIILTAPGEWRLLDEMETWSDRLGLPVEIRGDDRFFADHHTFQAFAAKRKTLKMETFYRQMRQETGILMEAGEPVGGTWNYDAQNRKALPKGAVIPTVPTFTPDAITQEVMELVATRFCDHFGTLATFNWPVTRDEAEQALDDFIAVRLPAFGDYQDAMSVGEPFLNHSLIAPLINCGLLSPREVCARAEAAWRDGRAPINAVEGFIRQILGWREFIRGVYWLKMPEYAESNALNAARPLPDFYWTGRTKMRCMAQAIDQTRDHAYAHHIQRLMVTGNFALLAGIAPAEIEAWYLVVYADAYEWVELPNVHGMAIFADGGVFASKPYAASGSYINKMSNYCRGCSYDVKQKTGDDACPFNYLYWNFLISNEDKLRGNHRLSMIYKTLDRMDQRQRESIVASSERFLSHTLNDDLAEPPLLR